MIHIDNWYKNQYLGNVNSISCLPLNWFWAVMCNITKVIKSATNFGFFINPISYKSLYKDPFKRSQLVIFCICQIIIFRSSSLHKLNCNTYEIRYKLLLFRIGKYFSLMASNVCSSFVLLLLLYLYVTFITIEMSHFL